MRLSNEQYNDLTEKLAEEANDILEAREVEASEVEEMAEKAAAVYQVAMAKIAAAQEAYVEAECDQEDCLEVLAEYGIVDEYGFNKEAAESDDELYSLAEEGIDFYNDALEKQAAASEVYADNLENASAAIEVLAALGYDVE